MMSIYKVRDGMDGSVGVSAPVAFLTNENMTFVLLIGLGIYLITVGVWPIAILMFLIAALLAYITAASAIRGRRKSQ